MGKFRVLLDEAEVVFKGKDTSRIEVDPRGRKLSPSAARIARAVRKAQGQSGFKLMVSLRSIHDKMKDFEKAVRELPKNSNGYDSVKYKIRRNFSDAILNLSNMVADLKKNGIKAVENKNEDMELWENLEISCQNILNWLKSES